MRSSSSWQATWRCPVSDEVRTPDIDYSPLLSLLDLDKKTASLISKESKAAKSRYERFRADISAFAKYYFPEYVRLEPAGWQKAIFDIFEHPARNEAGRWKWHVTKEQAERLASFHRAEFRHLPTEMDVMRGLLLVAPREQGKSTIFARILLIWLCCYDYVKFVTYFRANAELAEAFLLDTMSEFESNEKLIKDYGNLKGPIWNKGMYSLKNGAVFAAVGMGANIRGLVHKHMRPDLIILDDLTSDQNKNSPRMLDQIYDWIVSAIFGLSKDAVILYLNTIYNELDPMYRLQQRVEEGSLDRWLAVRLSAEISDGVALWPELWPIEELEFKKSEVGSQTYMVEYMSIITGGRDKILPREIFSFRSPTSFDIPEYEIHMGIDPNAEGSDDAAIFVLGRHMVTGRYLSVDAWCKDGATVTELVDQIVRFWRKYSPTMIAWEEVAFQRVYMKLLQEMLLPQGIALPLVPISAKGSKETRATALQPFLENGTWEHSEKLKDTEFLMKVQRFPTKGLNDGPVDAMSYAYLSFNRGLGSALGTSARRTSKLPGIIGRYKDGY